MEINEGKKVRVQGNEEIKRVVNKVGVANILSKAPGLSKNK